MAKSKRKPAEKDAKKKKRSRSPSEAPQTKKEKLNSKVSKSQDPPVSQVSEDPDSSAFQDDAHNDLNLEDLSPEERRILERKLKKERKKEEKRLQKERAALSVTEGKKEEPTKPSAGDLALQYLKSWSKKRSEWKFQKTRQTWLLMNMYDQEKVPDKYFRILLEYLGGLKGGARETTIQKAETYMKEHEDSEEQEESDSQRNARIRDVLQILS